MQRIFAFLIAAVAAVGLAFAQAPATKDAKKDAPKASTTQTDAKKSDAPKDAKADAKKVELMDINSASEKDLATLAGIGEARAKAIVKGRPYKGKDELLAKKIVPANVYKDIQGKIIAKQK
jgi:competence protein ComEA